MNEAETRQQKIILFDGICYLCTGSVIFILKRERSALFQFASIQSAAGQALLEWCGLPLQYDQAIVYIENGTVYRGSTAALKIGQKLVFPWSFFSHIGFIIPEPIRDWVYNKIAQNRYRWFGKKDICMVPAENLKARFL